VLDQNPFRLTLGTLQSARLLSNQTTTQLTGDKPSDILPSKPTMNSDLPWKKAIDLVLSEAQTPLHYNEIAETIAAKGYRSSMGATPATTVHTLLSTSLKRDGEASPYLRVTKGMFSLKPAYVCSSTTTPTPEKTSELTEEEQPLLTSFGMFWRRDSVEWGSSPKLLGVSQLGATPVDFGKQLGIYLLYDGREVIYVGRSSDRPLGRRLYEHTLDRLATRWDRFSWFGLLPVSEQGSLEEMPDTYPANLLIPALEALLIEAVEPRQNRKRGDDLSTAEYTQTVSPEIEKKRVKDHFERLLGKL